MARYFKNSNGYTFKMLSEAEANAEWAMITQPLNENIAGQIIPLKIS